MFVTCRCARHLVIIGEDVAGRALAVVDAGRAEAGHHAAAAAADQAADGVREAAEEGRLHAGRQGGVGLHDVRVLGEGLDGIQRTNKAAAQWGGQSGRQRLTRLEDFNGHRACYAFVSEKSGVVVANHTDRCMYVRLLVARKEGKGTVRPLLLSRKSTARTRNAKKEQKTCTRLLQPTNS